MKEEEIGKVFSEKLANYRQLPPEGLWTDIQNDAALLKFNRTRRLRKIAFRTAVSVAVIAIVAIGLGLKSASLSQCRVLTVASKTNGGIAAFQWDLDAVIQTKKWDCIELEQNEIQNIPNIKKLSEMQMGTLVVWQKTALLSF